jgi:predicted AlkP superfamily pyrophosphatase or phosphodiesterase
MMLARNGVEPPTPAFSELIFPVFPTTSREAVGLLNTGKYEQLGWTVGDCRG